jgi:hypothetical protein
MNMLTLRSSFFWILNYVDSLLWGIVNWNIGCLLLSFFLLTVKLTAQPFVLSEFMASNQSGMIDEDGDRSDWIEIYNTGTEPASLNGWYLSDDASDLTKWRFPDQFIPMQSSLIVFASGKDRKGVGAELHTNFKLSSKGGFLGLIQPDGRTIAHAYDPPYPTQLPDISYGITIRNERTALVSHDAVGNIHFPKDNSMALAWTMPDFDDSQWREVYFGIGYQQSVEGNNADPENPVEDPLVLGDVTRAFDPIDPSSDFSPVGEMVDAALDNNTATKYLNFDKLNTGFTVKLSLGPTAVSGLRLTSANDAPDRDPSQFVLSGSNDGINFVEIAKGAIPEFENRFETIQIDFQNTLKHAYYRLVFPTVRNERVAVAMQIAEVELLGWLPESSVSNSGETSSPVLIDVTMLEDISMPDDDIDPSSSNSPFGEEVWRAIDNDPQTKYLNFDGTGSGFTLKPGHGPTVVNGLRLTSANDAEGRDPTAYRLEGSSGGGVFELIAQGPLPLFEDRFSTVEVAFSNDLPFGMYRLVFPSLRASGGQIMQIAEVEFLGEIGLPPPAFMDLIQTDIKTSMYAQHASAYARLPFFAGEEPDLEGLSLNVRFDDGFIAYINGVEVARANAPNKLGFDSVAESDRGAEVAAIVKHFDLRPFESLIEPGENLLAIHALNDSVYSSDFLLETQLEKGAIRTVLSDVGYFEIPSPGLLNTDMKLGLVPVPIIDAESGFMKDAFDVGVRSEMEGVKIYYTTDGSIPDALSGHPYTSPIQIRKTTVLRAVGLRDGWIPSPVLTRSYLFTSDIALQDQSSALETGFPTRWGSQTADYGLDTRVVGNQGRDSFGGRYQKTIQDDLLSLPSMSFVMDSDALFGARGIYANPGSRGEAWEKPVSVELIYPENGRKGFQENAGLRIQGGAFRKFNLTLKKSFRLVFRGQYGASKLDFPLFGPDATDSFDNVVLRANGNDGWPYGGAQALYMRDAFAMETARAMGIKAPHTNFVHLYLNGIYWGLYNLVERPDAAFSSSYYGGDKENWDALNQDSVPDGNRDAWNRLLGILDSGIDSKELFNRIQGKGPDGIRDLSMENLLDVRNLIDYCILNFYMGNQDWPGRNFWVGRDREGDEGFKFYPWDTETSMGLGSDLNTDRTGVDSSVARPYAVLKKNPDFRLWFADRVQHHFFNGGSFFVHPDKPQWSVVKPENNVPASRFAQLAAQIERSIVGESARWGDQLVNRPFTWDDWSQERDNLLTHYFPRRSAIVLDQLRRAGLYPRIEAPAFNHAGGNVDVDFSLSMSAQGGTIFYTLDGSDPRSRLQSKEISRFDLFDSATQKRVLVPSADNGGDAFGSDWYEDVGFADDAWMFGVGGIGYDTGNDYEKFIGMDVTDSMQGQNGSVFIRIQFETGSRINEETNLMVLRMRYDDGFEAFLNGIHIASSNAPEILKWDSFATGTHEDSVAVQFQDFDISGFISHLHAGTNLLAIQGLNVSSVSSDFLIDAELMVGQQEIIGEQPTSRIYETPIILRDLTTIKARTLSGSEWSALSEATYVVGNPRVMVSELHFHPEDPSFEEMAFGYLDADEFEFIEIHNPRTTTFTLDGLRFVDGVDFDFTRSSIRRLSPGASLLLVKNRVAFEMRYGKGLPIAGEFTGNFSNSGERVALADSDNQVLIEFSYDDGDPVFKSGDGSGYTLIAVEDADNPNEETYWKTSEAMGGSPGQHSELYSYERLVPDITVEGDRILIECSVPVTGLFGLFVTEDLRLEEWHLLQSRNQGDSNGRLVFAVKASMEYPMRFFQIRMINATP